MPEPIRLRANAKLNLFLRVVGGRHRGWHEIETIFHSITLADVLQLTSAEPGVLKVDLTAPPSEQAYLPALEDDLVTTAAAAVTRLAPTPVGASIAVTKAIPIGAGLAGGSADAAATVVGLNELWELGLTTTSMAKLASSIGSDVAFCLEGGTAMGTGRGDDLTPLPDPPPMWFVLGISDRPLLTAGVYEAWDRVGRSAGSVDAMVRALAGGDPIEVGRHLHNDLVPAAVSLRPDIEEGIQAMRQAGAAGAGMTGSGPTVFGLAADRAHAGTVAQEVRSAFARVVVVASAPAGIEGLA
jgi:4-diphosphocytidyl-2-C-methyl-D-erythritol kinase